MERRRVARALVIATSMWALFHVYVAQRLLGQSPWPFGRRVLGWVAILMLSLGPVSALWAGRATALAASPAKPIIEVAGFTAMGLSSLLIVFAVAGDVLHLRALIGASGASAAVACGAVLVLAIGMWRARRAPVGRVVGIPHPHLPSPPRGGPLLPPPRLSL